MEHGKHGGFVQGRRAADLVSSPAFDLLEQRTGEGESLFSVRVPERCPFFAGHFPSRPVLPAVGQLALLLELVRHIDPGCWIAGADAVKFSRPVSPGDVLLVRIRTLPDGETVEFDISLGDDTISRGRLRLDSRARS